MLKGDSIQQKRAALTLARLGPAARLAEAELWAILRRADADDQPFFRVPLILMREDRFRDIQDYRRKQVVPRVA